MKGKLRFIWGERLNMDVDEMKFSHFFPNLDSPIHCGKFNQKVSISTAGVSAQFQIIHFTDLNIFKGGVMTVEAGTTFWSLNLSKYDDLTFEVIQPGIILVVKALYHFIFMNCLVAIPHPSILNFSIASEMDEIFIHLFYFKDDDTINYRCSFSGNFEMIKKKIEDEIGLLNFDSDAFISLKNAEGAIEAQRINQFFSKVSNLKEISIIILSTNVDGIFSSDFVFLFLIIIQL